MEFTFESYEELLNTFFEHGYEFCQYKNIDNFEKGVILRHDIDFSPSRATKVAKIEQDMGIKSTYFILLSTGFYNVFSLDVKKKIYEILNMGHQIGLHFDEQKYEMSSFNQMKEYVYNEVGILEKALDTKIETVSMHRPSQGILDASIEFDGLINSYTSKYFKEMKYLSDSRMCWRENPFSAISSGEHNKIHILTHPFWYASQSETIQTKIKCFLDEAMRERYDLLDKNFKNIQEYFSREDIK